LADKKQFWTKLGWTKDGLAYLKYGALEVSEVYYLTATAFDPADVVVAGDNGTAVGNDTLMGTNQAQIAMQWTVTTPVYLKSVEFGHLLLIFITQPIFIKQVLH